MRKALAREEIREAASFLLIGPEGPADEIARTADAEALTVGRWPAGTGEPRGATAGRLAVAAVERGIEAAVEGRIEGLVTAPLTKEGFRAAGLPHPGHTELLRDRTGVEEITMMMAAEETSAGGPLRMALLTGHVPLREVPDRLTVDLVVTRSRIAARALREWWGIERPRLAFAGVNPHASEGGMFGDEEERILRPALERIAAEGVAEPTGVFPADTVFLRCLDGRADAVVVPYHDVGLATLKTLAMERGVNVTAGLPFPRTSPDHGTAFDIADRGEADPGSMVEAIRHCVRFCRSSPGE